MNDQGLKERIRRARGKFAAMAGTYGLGVFNDSFYRQSAMLVAVFAGVQRAQGHVLFAFTLPFLAFAAYAGWMADRFGKNRIVIGAKAMELVAMICGAVGIVTLSWPLILVMACIMGWQSAIFSPALNGSIPELYPASYVTKANGILKGFVTASILAGVAAAGAVIGIGGEGGRIVLAGRLAVAGSVVLVSALGLAASFFVPRRPAANPRAKFPWAGPVDTAKELLLARKDRLLWTVICADTFVWFVGSAQILLINEMGRSQLGYSPLLTSVLVASEMLGLAVGGLLAGHLAKGERWHRVLAPAAVGMAACMGAVTLTPALGEAARLPVLLVLLGGTGISGGLLMIPCEAFIQVRPAAEKRGTVIASANFAVFSGILLSSWVGNELNAVVRPTVSYGLLGVFSLLAAGVLVLALPRKGQGA